MVVKIRDIYTALSGLPDTNDFKEEWPLLVVLLMSGKIKCLIGTDPLAICRDS